MTNVQGLWIVAIWLLDSGIVQVLGADSTLLRPMELEGAFKSAGVIRLHTHGVPSACTACTGLLKRHLL